MNFHARVQTIEIEHICAICESLWIKADQSSVVVEIGTLRRHIGLPRSMAMLSPAHAKLEEGLLTVEMQEAQ